MSEKEVKKTGGAKIVKKVGIFGGTFDPIHCAHLILAEHTWEQFQLDTVLLMPCAVPPHKEGREITAAFHRSRMVQLAIEDNNHLKLSNFELERKGTTYTADTVRLLSKEHPECEYFFILGADSLFDIEKWYHPEQILAQIQIVAAVRGDLEKTNLLKQIDYLKERYPGSQIALLDTPHIEISSTLIRENVRLGKTIKYYVPKDVEKYIYQQKLYQISETGR